MKSLKRLQTEVQKRLEKRNKEIIQEFILGDKTIRDLSKKHDITYQRVAQIVRSFGISVPLTKGTKKYKRWKKRISKSSKGKPKKRK